MTADKAIKMLEYIRRTGDGESEYKNDAQAIAIDMAIKALKQEPKSEWEHDNEILNAHSEGARQILDIIRAEIVKLQKDYHEYGWAYDDVIEIIDKYKVEGDEGEE